VFRSLSDADDSAPRNAAPCIRRNRKQIAPKRNSFFQPTPTEDDRYEIDECSNFGSEESLQYSLKNP
jgi:hypothetical protein